jgi:hypothetical protein
MVSTIEGNKKAAKTLFGMSEMIITVCRVLGYYRLGS